MRVKCIANTGRALPKDALMPLSGYDSDTVFDLSLGKMYVVYAITLVKGYPWYYLCDEAYTYYPVANPCYHTTNWAVNAIFGSILQDPTSPSVISFNGSRPTNVSIIVSPTPSTFYKDFTLDVFPSSC